MDSGCTALEFILNGKMCVFGGLFELCSRYGCEQVCTSCGMFCWL